MNDIRIIILDFDGTLGDTAAVIVKTMQATIQELGLPPRTDSECAAMIGLRLIEIPKVLFPGHEMDGDLYALTYRRLFHEYNTEGAVVLYPNVMETLEELKERGYILTIASSRSHASLAEYVENLGLSPIIGFILGADDVVNGKPDPEPVTRTLEKYGMRPEETIVVGDTVFDIKMGKNAGTRTCGVTYGNGSRESLADADLIIDDFGQLLEVLPSRYSY
jgi:HAD superfamily hydrolase (TIGR01509 family)